MAMQHLRSGVVLLVLALLSTSGWGQSFNASISGTVTDPTGASVPDVDLTLTAVATGAVAKATTGPDGLFAFPNLQRGAYELKAAAKGFREFVQKGIAISINDTVRVDVNSSWARRPRQLKWWPTLLPLILIAPN